MRKVSVQAWLGFLPISLMLSGQRECQGVVDHSREGSPLQKEPSHRNVSTTLDRLLEGYDSRLRPGHGGPPTLVKVDMNIRSVGPISEVDMTYSLDAYFRQTWKDTRLHFSSPLSEMAVHIKVLEKLWKPDTYFYNGHGSYLHTTTTPNKLLRIRQDGTLLYSMRLTIKANCPMYLQAFPVDLQSCPLQFGSYAYTNQQVIYTWKYGASRSIKIARDMRLSQYDLTGHPASNMTVTKITGTYSTLRVEFELSRHMGYFLIQVYVPCTLIVILSWVAFWINREATADRVGLGITSMLSLTTLCIDSSTEAGKVPYATALDWFIVMCFLFVSSSLLEFAAVHYFTKVGSGEHAANFFNDSSPGEDEEEEEDESLILYNQATTYVPSRTWNTQTSSKYLGNGYNGYGPAPRRHRDPCWMQCLNCLRGSQAYRKLLAKRTKASGVNSVSIIDKISRILFPVAFLTLNILYWVAYTT